LQINALLEKTQPVVKLDLNYAQISLVLFVFGYITVDDRLPSYKLATGAH